MSRDSLASRSGGCPRGCVIVPRHRDWNLGLNKMIVHTLCINVDAYLVGTPAFLRNDHVLYPAHTFARWKRPSTSPLSLMYLIFILTGFLNWIGCFLWVMGVTSFFICMRISSVFASPIPSKTPLCLVMISAILASISF